MRSPDLRRSAVRLRLVGCFLVLAFGVLAVRAAHLTVIDQRGAERGIEQTGTVLNLAPARGTIVDSEGDALAVTVSAPSVYAAPAEVPHRRRTARRLARILGVSAGRLRERLRVKGPFVFLARWISEKQAAAVRALDVPGIGIVEEPRRTYPHGALAGQLLGFANIDGVGVRGIEELEEPVLRGRAERVPLERDARGRLLARGDVDPRRAAGGDVAITVDASLQSAAASLLRKTVRATGARDGLVVALDPRNADLLALAQWPPFDPNQFRTTPFAKTRSRAFLDAAEPGSTMKPFLVAAAFEKRVLRTDQLIDCDEGHFHVPGKTIHDTHPHAFLDPAGILRVSSNIGAAKIGFLVGARDQYQVLRAFGFGAPTGSGFPDESSGLLRSWRSWRPVDHATISFGQGISVTAIQLASAMAALANGGVWRAPRLVKAVRAPGGRWREIPPHPGHQVVRRQVADTVLSMLQGVVGEDGTAPRAALRGLRVAGKTGTAQKLDPATGRYSQDRYRTWFIGAAPVEAPQIAILVMIDEPAGRFHTAGSVAAPLFAQVAAAALAERGIATAPVLGLPRLARVDAQQPHPASEVAPAAPRALAARAATRPTRKPPVRDAAASIVVTRLGDRLLLPDFRGLTEAQVKRITAKVPLRVMLVGSGRAVEQEPAPGTIVGTKNTRLRVRFDHRGEEG